MNLVYNQEKIPVTITKNKNIMRYKFPKLYYAIIIEDCNRYSSIASKQRVDIVMTDNDLKILSYKKIVEHFQDMIFSQTKKSSKKYMKNPT